MNSKWIWLVVGIILGVYVVPMLRDKVSSN